MLRAGVPAVRVGVVTDLAVSYGLGVPEDAAYLERARGQGVAVVRRGSGGTGVLHAPGDIVWSVVLPRSDARVGRDFVRAYPRLGAGVVRFLARHTVPAEWGPPPDLVADYCVLSARGQVLTARGRVLGGAAQHLSRSAILHQGTLPHEVDRPRIAELFSISDPELTGRLVGLRELGLGAPPQDLAHELATGLVSSLGR
jgi:lipoate-protein ligase A